MSGDLAWIDSALTVARPRAVGALLRYFRDLDVAEEAYQDACLRALRSWPQNGPPRMRDNSTTRIPASAPGWDGVMVSSLSSSWS